LRLVRYDRTTVKSFGKKLRKNKFMAKLAQRTSALWASAFRTITSFGHWTGWKIFGTSLLEHLVIAFGSKASKFSALKARSKTLKKQIRKYLPECGLSARNSKLFSKEAVLTLSILKLA
jgi:hypothetical protein